MKFFSSLTHRPLRRSWPTVCPFLAHAQLLCGALGRRRDRLANDEGQRGEKQRDLHEAQQEASGRHAGGAQHGDLRMPRQRRQGIERADQHGDRHQLIDAAGRAQQDEEDRVVDLVRALADVLHFGDHVEEAEQREEADEDKKDPSRHFARKVAPVNHHRTHLASDITAIRR